MDSLDIISRTGVKAQALHGRIEAVVLGVSAGGVDALSILLPALPKDFRPALLIVMHLPRDRPSLLIEIFERKCVLPVREAQDKEPVQPGTVYFAPPDYHLLVDEGPCLSLSADDPVYFSRPSIDVLFESAADIYGSHLAAVILTGANADGARGTAAVREAGGITVAQTPETALAAAMPLAAIARGPIDFILPLEQVARLLRVMGSASGS
ncbi:chemotaxis protein CheB [Stigmatella sp. ncwal1]|uniref:protein-glutamate methylesterase n=1 Tax=Stigmatella ashevillensis TaxID=2995309 RepID=A0ABT5DLZ4_9BACT|nr:chemotaxis protein CheB [Stigmatella ashevillena]MDC0714687.1 chemotaxis protein CheB [Stigmatella ashevillena]